jgi:ribonuclease G
VEEVAAMKEEIASSEPQFSAETESAADEPRAEGSHADDDLTDEQAASLAEQMSEVEHERAQADAMMESAEEENGVEEHAENGEMDESEGGETEPAVFESDETDQEIRQGILDAATDYPEAEAQPNFESQPRQARVESDHRPRFQRPMRRGGSGGRRRGGRGDRGDRPHFRRHQGGHGGHRPSGASRRPQLISEMLKAGQEIIVQIAKEPLGKKGARITSHVALPGRYLVYMPTVNHIGVSRKIASSEKRSRLRHIVGDAKKPFPGGFIVRTAAETATEEEIRNDVEFLGRTWSEIRQKSEQRKAPAILHRDLNLVERILRDHLSSDYVAIWIDNEEEYTKVLEFVSRFQPQLADRVKLYTKEAHIFEEFGIQQEIDKSLRPKVWLKSGGYIVINHTEALVAIDVNTGKFVGKGSTRLEDTIVKTNLEAVKEVVRQIRLRDLGGIIVIDFIDMEERRNRDKVMAALDDALRRDRAPSKALGFNEFGLVAITRKRTKQALERVLCQPCPACSGSGMVKSLPTICYEIQAEARKMAPELDGASVTLRVHPEIAKALKTREAVLIDELEKWTRKNVIIQSDPTLHWEQYDIY